MRNLRFVIKRLFYMVFVLVGISMLIFLLARVMPGDPARIALGPDASKAQVEQLRERLGLDKPPHIQYYIFIKEICRGHMGISLVTRRDVSQDIRDKFPATFELVAFAMFLALAGGLVLGIIASLNKDKAPDHASRMVAFAGVSLPRFWIGIMFQLVFAYYLGLLPLTGRVAGIPPTHITGLYLLDGILTGNWRAFGDSFMHILLPATTLCLSTLAQITRLLRASMVEQLRKDYTLVNRLMGMPEGMNIYKYMLKNAVTSTLTITGLAFGSMLGNAFIVEKVFNWPGMARYGVNAVLQKDFNAIIGVTIVIGLGYLVINFFVDLIYLYLDPRIRLRG